MLKHIGLILCAMACVGAGAWKSIRQYRRSRLIASLSKFADAINEGVTRYAYPQETIYGQFYDNYLENVGFSKLLERECDKNPCGALYNALIFFFENEDPGKEAKNAFLSFAKDFGTLGMIEQAQSCDQLSARLHDLSKIERKNIRDEIRLSLTTGFTAGCGILILFW